MRTECIGFAKVNCFILIIKIIAYKKHSFEIEFSFVKNLSNHFLSCLIIYVNKGFLIYISSLLKVE